MAGQSKEGYRPVAASDDHLDQIDPMDERKAKRALHADAETADDEAYETHEFLPRSMTDEDQTGERSSQMHRAGKDGRWLSRRTFRTAVVALLTSLVVCLGFKFVSDNSGLFLALPGTGNESNNHSNKKGQECGCATTTSVPQHFQTTPQLWAGPTATGRPAFLAQTVTIDPTATYVANQPLQTNIAVEGQPLDGSDGASIFRHMGYLSPYNPAPGFGVQEYALPPGAEIIQVQMLSRHGSRYPTLGNGGVAELGEKLAAAKGKFTATDRLSFLQDWEYRLGHEILVPKGRQELFDSGVLHAYNYAHLYNTNSKIIVRTTTQDRMLKSAENFLAGFFGLEWTNNATIEVIIEQSGFNNSLAGSLNCPNHELDNGGTEAAKIWVQNYLQNATARLQSMVEGIDWTIADTYAAQTLCPYETAAFGFSRFCDLFTHEEWKGYGYSIDLSFAGNYGFQSSTARAVGLGYQQELLARLQNHTLGYAGSQINVTLDNNTDTFPLNQSLYLDFSHDTNIVSILTALGLKQFSALLPPTSYPGDHNFTVTHIVPFGARFELELIRTPRPVAADRSGFVGDADHETKYVHLVLNQRTVPLGVSFPECDVQRVDGWCELDTFLRVQEEMAGRAKYEQACHGPFKQQPYGTIMDGAPM